MTDHDPKLKLSDHLWIWGTLAVVAALWAWVLW